jgi:hypothetical protein
MPFLDLDDHWTTESGPGFLMDQTKRVAASVIAERSEFAILSFFLRNRKFAVVKLLAEVGKKKRAAGVAAWEHDQRIMRSVDATGTLEKSKRIG